MSHAIFLFTGYKSWRHFDKGALFIQTLCQVMNEHGKDKDIFQLITMVNYKVAYEKETFDPIKQTIESRFTLTKFLKF
jgi:hypothetical protein